MRSLLLFCATIGLILALSGTSQAGFTTIYNTSYGKSSAYGAEWDLHSGLSDNLANPGGDNTVNVGDILDYNYTSWTRIHDYGVIPNDQVWLDLDGSAQVKAIYTSNYLYLGYSTNESTGSPKTWLSGSGGGKLDTVGETASFDIVPNTDAFVWVIGVGSTTKYSNQTLNGGTDFMVSFRIHGIYNDPTDHTKGSYAPSDPTYVIAFEDGTDKDYQDFVAQLSNVQPVPEPATLIIWSLLGGVGIAGAWWRRRRKAA